MALRSIKEAGKLTGKRVLVRVDFNVPVEKGKVIEDTRLRASLPTIQYLMRAGAKVILATHLGRPEGKPDKAFVLNPVAKALTPLLDKKVKKMDEVVGISVTKAVDSMKCADVILLENVRFSPEEKDNKGVLAQELAHLADIFVLDGFAVAHRADASIVGVPAHIPGYAGLLLDQEMTGLNRILKRPKKPFVVVLGGAKMETKVPVLKHLLPKAGRVLVGGGIVNTMLKARGYDIGASLCDDAFLKEAKAYAKKRKVILPVDVVVGAANGKNARVVEVPKKPTALCEKNEGIFDIGPKTIALFAKEIKKAKTLVWNGAMGFFEQKPYDTGTLSVARLVASRSKRDCFGVIGGGETLQAMDAVGMSEHVDLVSTGGGAMLEYLSGETLPGIAALE